MLRGFAYLANQLAILKFLIMSQTVYLCQRVVNGSIAFLSMPE